MSNEKAVVFSLLTSEKSALLIFGVRETLDLIEFRETRDSGVFYFRTSPLNGIPYSNLFKELRAEGYVSRTAEGFTVEVSYHYDIAGGGSNGIKIGYFFLSPSFALTAYRLEGENPVTL